jgi:hypothetical protein
VGRLEPRARLTEDVKGEVMNPELLKVEFKRGIAALLPYAQEHKQKRTAMPLKAPRPEHRYEFPPYFMIFTIEVFPGADCPMVSVSAPMRPVKMLTAPEKDTVKEAFSEIFPDYRLMTPRAILPGSTAFKVVAFPPGAPAELLDVYRALDTLKR